MESRDLMKVFRRGSVGLLGLKASMRYMFFLRVGLLFSVFGISRTSCLTRLRAARLFRVSNAFSSWYIGSSALGHGWLGVDVRRFEASVHVAA